MKRKNKEPVHFNFMAPPARFAPFRGGGQYWIQIQIQIQIQIFAFNSQTSDNFQQKIGFFENLEKFDEMLRNFWPFWPGKAPILDAFHWKTPYFCALCHWKTPFFDAICHWKTPTSEVLGGTRRSLSYVSAPQAS